MFAAAGKFAGVADVVFNGGTGDTSQTRLPERREDKNEM
jgi:hypothetical protein